MLQLNQQKLEKTHQFLRNLLLPVVEEEQDVLTCRHLLIVVVASQLVGLIAVLGFTVEVQLMAFGLLNELLQAGFSVGRRGNVERIVQLID